MKLNIILRNVKILFLLVILCLTFLYCDNDENKDDDTTQDESSKEEQKNFTPFSVIDMKGREVIVNNKIERLIVSYRPAMFFVLALGEQDKLVTMIQTKGRPSKNDPLPYKLNPDLKDLPKIKGGAKNLNIEEIAYHKPDLVILYPNNPQPVIRKLNIQNIPSIVIEPESIKKIKETILLLGKVLNAKNNTDLLINYYDSIIKEINEELDSAYGKDKIKKPKVYYADSNLLDTISGEMLQSDMINRAGGINISGHLKGWKQSVSYEELIKWNPDIIIISSFSNLLPDEILNNEQIRDLSAVQSKRVFKMPSNLDPWDFPAPNSIMGIYWLAHQFYPDFIDFEKFNSKVNKFYKDIYGISFDQLGGKL
ncbi:MAG: ABC transporter substrate-binding protein [Spirochaetota bacterium]